MITFSAVNNSFWVSQVNRTGGLTKRSNSKTTWNKVFLKTHLINVSKAWILSILRYNKHILHVTKTTHYFESSQWQIKKLCFFFFGRIRVNNTQDIFLIKLKHSKKILKTPDHTKLGTSYNHILNKNRIIIVLIALLISNGNLLAL